eukprot:3906073-Pyramimonas_sp.AAC.1
MASTQPESAPVSKVELLRLWDSAQPLQGSPWSSSRDPIRRAALVLQRAGWEVLGPLNGTFTAVSTAMVDQAPPSLLADMIDVSIQRQREMASAAKLGYPLGSWPP